MTNDVPAHIYLLGIGIPAVATIIVAWFSKRGGDKLASKAEPYVPHDSSEHSRTRDAIHSMRREMHLRFDAQDNAVGTERQQEQVTKSAVRVIDGKEVGP